MKRTLICITLAGASLALAGCGQANQTPSEGLKADLCPSSRATVRLTNAEVAQVTARGCKIQCPTTSNKSSYMRRLDVVELRRLDDLGCKLNSRAKRKLRKAGY